MVGLIGSMSQKMNSSWSRALRYAVCMSGFVAPTVRPETAQGEALGADHAKTRSPIGALFRTHSIVAGNVAPIGLPLVRLNPGLRPGLL